MPLTRKELIGAAAGAAVLAGCNRSGSPGPAADLGSWEGVQESLALSRDERNFAAFYLSSHPRPVREAIERHRRGLDAGARQYLRDHEQELEEAAVRAAAEYLGVPIAEVALTASTTQGAALVYGGLRLRPGDELVMTEHDFYATHVAVRQAAERAGARVRVVRLYDNPARVSEPAVVDAIAAAVTARTRAVAITWVHSSTGVKLPVAAIARMLRSRAPDALLCVDAVHGFGAEADRPEDLGCHVLFTGCHKWLAGPRGTGLVWATQGAWERIDPLVPSFDFAAYGAWLRDEPPPAQPAGAVHSPGGFHAFELRWALPEAFAFHEEIGRERIAQRLQDLATRLKSALARTRGVTLVTPADPAFSAGLVCFDVDRMNAPAVVEALAGRAIVATVTPYAVEHVRLGVGIHLDEADVDAAASAVAALA